MVSKDGIWKFVKSERFIIVWWNVQWIGSLFILGWHHPGKLLVDIWLIVSIACYVLGLNRMKKLGAISLAFYAFFTLIVTGVIVYYFVYDGGVNSEVVFYFILPILFITLLNLLMAFRAIKILAKKDDSV